MRARVTVSLGGNPGYQIGDVAEGAEAVRLVEANFAVPLVEVRKVEKAVRSTVKKETRSTFRLDK